MTVHIACICSARDTLPGDTFTRKACWACGEPMYPYQGEARQIWEIGRPIFEEIVSRVEKSA